MAGGFAIGWRQVGASFVLLASNSFIASAYSVVAVPLGQTFHPSRMVLMLAMTIMAAVSAILSPFAGALMDRTSLRRMILAGALLLPAGYVALSFAGSFTQVLAVYALIVAPANVLMGPLAATVLLSRWFDRRRGRAMGIAIAGIAFGSVVFPPILQALLDGNDWRVAFRLFALVLLACTLTSALLVVDRPADRGLHPDGDGAEVGVANRARDGAPVAVSARAILTDPAFWLAAAIFATVLSGLKGMMTNLVPLAIDQGIRASDAALLISIYGACGFGAKLTFAMIADRLAPRTLIFASLAGFVAAMLCMSQAAAGYATIAAGVALAGLFGGIMVPLQSLLVPRIFGAHVVGRAMGLISMATLCALLATPPIFGRVFDVTGSYAGVFIVFAVLTAAMMLAAPYLRLQPRIRPEPVPVLETA